MNVLIVDDDLVNLDLFAQLVKAIPDTHAIKSPDPIKALEWCRHHEPDLLLLDFMMPVMDGLQFLQAFRDLPGKSETPVIMITADIQNKLRHKALLMHANDFLVKPVDKTDFCEKVVNLLTVRTAQLKLASRSEWMSPHTSSN